MLKEIRMYALCSFATGFGFGCDKNDDLSPIDTVDADADADGDTDSDSDSFIDSAGTTDLIYNSTLIEDPGKDLPLLEGTTPSYTPALAEQALPDGTVSIYGLQGAFLYLGFSSEEELAAALRQSGVVRQKSTSWNDTMSETLDWMSGINNMSVFVTSDTFFNVFHNFSDNLLLGWEQQSLMPELLAFVAAVKTEAAKRYNSLPDGKTRDAALDVTAYLQVAESLLDPDSEIIEETKTKVNEELALIFDHRLFAVSPIFNRPEYSEGACSVTLCPANSCECMICADGSALPCADGVETQMCPERHCEDYTQYVPRGHYTYSDATAQYFRAMMWLGRMTFFNRSDQSARGMIILLDSIKSAEVSQDSETISAASIWRHLYRVIGTFMGTMDDLTVDEIDATVSPILGDNFNLEDLEDDALIDTLQEEIGKLRDPKILSGLMSAMAEMGESTKGLRLMGQVFLPDSYVLGQTVFRNVGPSAERDNWGSASALCGIDAETDPETLSYEDTVCICDAAFYNKWYDICRGLPSGLDVASSFGHTGAREKASAIWSSYAGYESKLDSLKDEIDAFDLLRWSASVTWNRLFAVKALFADAEEGAPAFMRTPEWSDKTLETGLTAWAESRHDAILYTKESYTDADADVDADTDADADADEEDFNYLEPQPQAYARLAASIRRIAELGVKEGLFNNEDPFALNLVDNLASRFEEAEDISVKELEGLQLDDSDIQWILSTGSNFTYYQEQLLLQFGILGENQKPDLSRLSTRIIADVHTFPAKPTVLEVGSGYLEYVAVLHQTPNGYWGVAIGPAYSYREFEQDANNRLTDEAWRAILESQDPLYGSPPWLP